MPTSATAVLDAPVEHQPSTYSRNFPFPATVKVNRLLTGPSSEKETRHIEISLEGSGIQYLPGDSVGVLPENRSDMVEDDVDAAGLQRSKHRLVEHGDIDWAQKLIV